VKTILFRVVVSAIAAAICAREAWRADVAIAAERALYARTSHRGRARR